jgi:hypothetical protein
LIDQQQRSADRRCPTSAYATGAFFTSPIAKEVGTSVRTIEQHYAGVIENWDGWLPADDQIRAARYLVDPK